jgi:hypothetical protein
MLIPSVSDIFAFPFLGPCLAFIEANLRQRTIGDRADQPALLKIVERESFDDCRRFKQSCYLTGKEPRLDFRDLGVRATPYDFFHLLPHEPAEGWTFHAVLLRDPEELPATAS